MMIGLIELLIVLPYVGMIISLYNYYPIMLVLNHTIGAAGGKLRKTNMLISRGHLLYRNTTSTWAELIWRICSLSYTGSTSSPEKGTLVSFIICWTLALSMPGCCTGGSM